MAWVSGLMNAAATLPLRGHLLLASMLARLLRRFESHREALNTRRSRCGKAGANERESELKV